VKTQEVRANEIFQNSLLLKRIASDRLFFWLLIVQWVVAMGITLVVSPYGWEGNTKVPHVHLIAAVIVGGLINALPLALIRAFPGWWATRQVVTIAQMLWSAFLIHLTGGRIETHFHVFVSLAFLAFYLDWRLLVTATLVVAGDHLIRGFYWPESVYGVANPEWWRFLEHAAWVVFEDIVLVLGCRRSLAEIKLAAEREASLEVINLDIEDKIRLRTQELTAANESLASEIKARAKMETELVEVSRQAGMAEVATSVLHNVGNVLNSVNVSATLVADRVKKSKVASLPKVIQMLNEHSSDLGSFLVQDPKGNQIPGYLGRLSENLISEQSTVVQELDSLQQNLEHIKDIVARQQGYAKVSGVVETVKAIDLVEDALLMNSEPLRQGGVHVIRDYADVDSVETEKHKVLQILVNLIRNAEHACRESGQKLKTLTLTIVPIDKGIRIAVTDNGIGIAEENLTRIFNHGFTTRKDGHGFGLHSGALTAKELGGALTVHSDGPDKGATFTLELPLSLRGRRSLTRTVGTLAA